MQLLHRCGCNQSNDLPGGGSGNIAEALRVSHAFASAFRPLPPTMSLGSLPVPTRVGGQGPETIGRLVVESLGGPCWWSQGAETEQQLSSGSFKVDDEARQEQQVVAFVRQLRQVLQDSRCSAMVTCPAGVRGTGCGGSNLLKAASFECMSIDLLASFSA